MLGAGALFRLVLVPTPPVLSDDLYRYLWDGRVQAAGINPYAHPPNAPELGLRTPTAWKLVVVTADIAATFLLARLLGALGRDRRAVVAYAWNPLPILAFGHSGHVDAVVVLGLIAVGLAWQAGALHRVGLYLGLAAAVKLYPLVALPAFVRDVREHWSTRRAVGVSALAAGVVAASYLPVASLGSQAFGYLAAGYLWEEGYTTGRRFLLFRALGLDGRLLGPLLLVTVVIVVLRSRRPAPTRAAWVLGAGWVWPWLGVVLETAYVGQIVRTTDRALPFSTPARVTAAAAIVLLALAATRWTWARRAVIAT